MIEKLKGVNKELLELLLDPARTNRTCFLCFQRSETTLNVSQKLEVHVSGFAETISLYSIIETLFPSHEILLKKVCERCSNLIIELYVVMKQNKVYTSSILGLVEDLDSKIGQNTEDSAKGDRYIIDLGQESKMYTDKVQTSDDDDDDDEISQNTEDTAEDDRYIIDLKQDSKMYTEKVQTSDDDDDVSWPVSTAATGSTPANETSKICQNTEESTKGDLYIVDLKRDSKTYDTEKVQTSDDDDDDDFSWPVSTAVTASTHANETSKTGQNTEDSTEGEMHIIDLKQHSKKVQTSDDDDDDVSWLVSKTVTASTPANKTRIIGHTEDRAKSDRYIIDLKQDSKTFTEKVKKSDDDDDDDDFFWPISTTATAPTPANKTSEIGQNTEDSAEGDIHIIDLKQDIKTHTEKVQTSDDDDDDFSWPVSTTATDSTPANETSKIGQNTEDSAEGDIHIIDLIQDSKTHTEKVQTSDDDEPVSTAATALTPAELSKTGNNQPKINIKCIKSQVCDVSSKTCANPRALNIHRKGDKSKPRSCRNKTQKTDKTTFKRVFKCKDCKYENIDKHMYDAHINTQHLDLRPHVCEICGKRFYTKAYLTEHSNHIHSNVKLYTCERCSKSFAWKKSLVEHMRLHTGERPYSCETCGETFATNDIRKKHVQKKHKDRQVMDDKINGQNIEVTERCRVYRCRDCKYENVDKHMYDAHINTQHLNVRPHVCEICGKRFYRKSHLMQHSNNIHSNVKLYSCEFCGKSTTWKKSFEDHMRLHTGERPYSCETCGEKFATTYTRYKHIKKEHKDKQVMDDKIIGQNIEVTERRRVYKCRDCKYENVEKHMYETHINKQHLNLRPHVCEICGKRFYRKSNLTEHSTIIHSNVKLYTCEFCGKSFAWKKTFADHMRLHTGAKPYSCKTCGETFATSDIRNKHFKKKHKEEHDTKRVYKCNDCNYKNANRTTFEAHIKGQHLRLRPYVCEICGKGFNKKSHLTHHVNYVHCNVKLYTCETCGKSFARERNFEDHLKLHTGEKPYRCGTCGKTYVKSNVLKAHVKKKHETIQVIRKTIAQSTEDSEKGGRDISDLSQRRNCKAKTNAQVCDVCGKTCSTPRALTVHRKGHESKPCPYCNKILKTNHNFNIHVRKHKTGETRKKKLKCNVCKYETVNKSSLEAHMNRQHLNLRPHVCEICCKGFYKKGHLTDHVNYVHCDVKLCTCDICGESFALKRSLVHHLKLHFGEKNYCCEACGKAFVNAGRRNAHVKLKHGKK